MIVTMATRKVQREKQQPESDVRTKEGHNKPYYTDMAPGLKYRRDCPGLSDTSPVTSRYVRKEPEISAALGAGRLATRLPAGHAPVHTRAEHARKAHGHDSKAR